MTTDRSNSSPPSPASDGRLISLSDAVFAFAMTLMVITLNVPKPESVSTADLPAAVQKQWPEFLSFGLTFWIIATYWFVHRRFFRQITGEDSAVGWINMLFLFSIVFLPYPTDMMGEFSESRFALIFYATTMIASSLILTTLWEYSRRRGLMAKDVEEREYLHARLRRILMPGVMLISIGLSFFSLPAARMSWSLILIGEIGLRRLGSGAG